MTTASKNHRIAVLGWGSLLWDLDDLAPKVRGDWARGGGPQLRFEFSRISPKRKQALVVAIDPENGASCPTSAIESIRADINDAIADLAARERTSLTKTGFVDLETGATRSAYPESADLIADWCRANGWRGAVWTDLAPNFSAKTGTPFSHEAAIDYFRSLKKSSFEEGVRYMANAPETTSTPLRRRIAQEAWWVEALARIG